MAKIAVIQTAFPGDVVLCTPVFESLAGAGHSVVAIVRPESEALLRRNRHVDHILPYDKKAGAAAFFACARKLRQHECDAAVIVQRYYRSALLALAAGIGKRIGYDTAPARFLYTDQVHYDVTRHEVERCLALCNGLSPMAGFRPRIFLDERDSDESAKMLSNRGVNLANFVVMAPGSIWPTKRWPGYTAMSILLRDRLKFDIVLLGSPQDRAICEEIAAGSRAVNLAGQTDLLQSAAIIGRARLTVTNDSAPAHIAAAVGTPVVAVFGPTVRRFGFAPYADKAVVVENKYLSCRPCTTHGSRKCPLGHFMCMKDITAQQVWESCRRFLE